MEMAMLIPSGTCADACPEHTLTQGPHECMYRILPSIRPWAHEIHRPKSGVGAYTDKPFVYVTHIRANHRIVKNWGWELTQRWVPTWENMVYVTLSG